MKFEKSQVFGLIIFALSVRLSLFWDKQFEYAGFFDLVLGVFAAIGISATFKLLPIFKRPNK